MEKNKFLVFAVFVMLIIFSSCNNGNGGEEKADEESEENITADDDEKERQLSHNKKLISFGIVYDGEKFASGNIDEENCAVTVTLPFNMPAGDHVARFSVSDRAVVKIGNEVQDTGVTENNFLNPVIYTVEAEDKSNQNYTVSVINAVSASKEIISFGFPLLPAEGEINGTDITVIVPYGTDLTSLVPMFSHTGMSVQIGSTEQISGITENDFSSSLRYTVTAFDNSYQEYTITVSAAPDVKAPSDFIVAGTNGETRIDNGVYYCIGEGITFTFSASDSESGLKGFTLKPDGSEAVPGNMQLSKGRHIVYAVDNAGNISSGIDITVAEEPFELYDMNAVVCDVTLHKTIKTLNINDIYSMFDHYGTNWDNADSGEVDYYSTNYNGQVYIHERDWILGPDSVYGRYICSDLGIPYSNEITIYNDYDNEENCPVGRFKAINAKNSNYSAVYNWYTALKAAHNSIVNSVYELGSEKSIDFSYIIDKTDAVKSLGSSAVSYTETADAMPLVSTYKYIAPQGSVSKTYTEDFSRSFVRKETLTKHSSTAGFKSVKTVSFRTSETCSSANIRENSDLVSRCVINGTLCTLVLRENILPQTGTVAEVELSFGGETVTKTIQIQ